MESAIYLDYNATAPLAPEVLEAMEPWLLPIPTNPGPVHRFGQSARAAAESARAEIAAFCGGGDVIFTSGGTESDNLAITSLLGRPPSGHLIVSAIDHPAVLEPAGALAPYGVTVDTIAVNAEGLVDPAAFVDAIQQETALISVMTANNEIGTIQPVSAIAAAARERGVPVHTDAVQGAAWLDLAETLSDVDLISITAHKIGGPPGIGALIVRGGRQIRSNLHGGGQQGGRRPGTEPTPLMVGFAAACKRVEAQREAQARRVGELSRAFIAEVEARTAGVRLTVPTAPRLPNTVHLCFRDCPADLLVARADLDGLAVSAGSACASGVAHGSHVLAALGMEPGYAAGAVRVSLGYDTTAEETSRAAEVLAGAVDAVRTAIGSHAS